MRILILLFIFTPLASLAQKKSYAFVQPALFLAERVDNKFHINAGGGFAPVKWLGVGANIDAYIFKKERRFWIPKLDLRYFIPTRSESSTPFLAFQPGWMVYKNTDEYGVTTKGDYSYDILGGFQFKSPLKKLVGVTISAGYSNFSFSRNGYRIPYKGLKIQAGLLF